MGTQSRFPNLATHHNHLGCFLKAKIPQSYLKPAESESPRGENWIPIFNKLPGASYADSPA